MGQELRAVGKQGKEESGGGHRWCKRYTTAAKCYRERQHAQAEHRLRGAGQQGTYVQQASRDTALNTMDAMNDAPTHAAHAGVSASCTGPQTPPTWWAT
jgi:hypothetical protein